METTEVKIQINIPEGKKLVDTKVENGVIIPIFEDKEVELSNTWEDWCKKNTVKDFVYIDSISNVNKIVAACAFNFIPSIQGRNAIKGESRAKVFLALMQLMNLRDEYRQGWEPDYGDYRTKYVITNYGTAIQCEEFLRYSAILSFQSAGIRDKFYANFKDLIEQAKELI